MKRVLKNSILIAAAASAIAWTSSASAGGRSDLVLRALDAGKADYRAGELIIEFKENATAEDRRAVRNRVNGNTKRVLREKRGRRLELTTIQEGISMAAAVRLLENDPRVEFAEPNWTYTTQATSNDTYYTNGSLWGMYGDASSPSNQYGSQAAEAWANDHTDCSNVWVGIIDTGYMYAHNDLAANAATNPGEIAGNGVDDDGNGYVDDVYGWDFYSNNSSVFDSTADSHGTHVAGTIGGVGGNGQGVAGVCWDINMIGAKFIGTFGGSTADAIDAIDYITDLKTRHGVDVVATNNSWGGGGYSQALYNAIERANDEDILFIAAAGNSALNCDNASCYPAEYTNDNVISVAGIQSNGARYNNTNYGASTIDIGAPAVGVVSTVPAGRRRVRSAYASYTGTSMAAPHVTGAAALYKSQNPNASAADIKAAILNAGVPTNSMSGITITGDRLDVSGF